jgi:hypothetical protein
MPRCRNELLRAPHALRLCADAIAEKAGNAGRNLLELRRVAERMP